VLAAGGVVRHDGDLLRVLSAPAHMAVTEGRRRLALREDAALLCAAKGGLRTRLRARSSRQVEAREREAVQVHQHLVRVRVRVGVWVRA
jgi:hypothetical protein